MVKKTEIKKTNKINRLKIFGKDNKEYIIGFDKSKGFTTPQAWNKEKWLELVNSKNNLLKSE